MSGRKIAMAAAAAISLSACQVVSDPPKKVVAQDVEFLRGCWVAKAGPNGPVTRFLRLLPEGAEGQAYQGYLHTVDGAEMTARLYFSFTRDGATMTMRQARPGADPMQADGSVHIHAPLPLEVAAQLAPAKHRATYMARADEPTFAWLIAEGDGETLRVYPALAGGQAMAEFFKGERDGCD